MKYNILAYSRDTNNNLFLDEDFATNSVSSAIDIFFRMQKEHQKNVDVFIDCLDSAQDLIHYVKANISDLEIKYKSTLKWGKFLKSINKMNLEDFPTYGAIIKPFCKTM